MFVEYALVISEGFIRMQKVAVKLPEPFVASLDALVKQGFYIDRADAIRLAVRDLLREELYSRRRRPESATVSRPRKKRAGAPGHAHLRRA